MTDEQIRQWILNDPGLYSWAREGHASDDEMYKHLKRFIKTNRSELVHRIQATLNKG